MTVEGVDRIEIPCKCFEIEFLIALHRRDYILNINRIYGTSCHVIQFFIGEVDCRVIVSTTIFVTVSDP